MITFVRSATIVPGKQLEAITWSKEIAELVGEVIGVEVRVMTPIASGNYLQVAWVAQYENLAAVEEANSKMLASEAFAAKIQSAAGLFTGENTQDTMWREV